MPRRRRGSPYIRERLRKRESEVSSWHSDTNSGGVNFVRPNVEGVLGATEQEIRLSLKRPRDTFINQIPIVLLIENYTFGRLVNHNFMIYND